MGIFLFLTIFLILILFFFISKNSSVNKKTEVRGLDGTSLVFSESGITYAGSRGVKFIPSSSIKKLSLERENGFFLIKIQDDEEEIRVPLPPEEVRKLFKTSPNGYLTPLFPYLPVISGIATGLLLGSLLSQPTIVETKEEEEKEESSTENEGYEEEEWFDDDQL